MFWPFCENRQTIEFLGFKYHQNLIFSLSKPETLFKVLIPINITVIFYIFAGEFCNDLRKLFFEK